MKYEFACDPDHCDTYITMDTVPSFRFPTDEPKMTCVCGRNMNLISIFEVKGVV